MPVRFLDAFFPPLCIGCGGRAESAGMLCSDCFSRLQFISAPVCRVCGTPLSSESVAGVCGGCLIRPHSFSAARAALRYGGVAKDLILALKYGDKTDVVPWMAKITANAGRELFKDADALLPVPLHPFRLLSRKYNQAALLADGAAKLSGVPSDPFVLQRLKPTAKQGHFSQSERVANVKGAFGVSGKKDVKGKTFVLIDDVLTSGATADECALVLKKAGAKDVRVLTFARAVMS